MSYRDDFANKMATSRAGCGGMPPMVPVLSPAGGTQSAPFSPAIHQSFTHNGSIQGTQVMPSLPMVPAAGAVTTTSPASPPIPAFQGAIAPQNGIPLSEQVPSTLANTFFTPGFLRTQIGRRMRVEFLLGTNLLTDRTGTLVAVGASYIVLRLIDSDDLMMCDIYSIKFATIIL